MPIERHFATTSWPARSNAIRTPFSFFLRNSFDHDVMWKGVNKIALIFALPILAGAVAGCVTRGTG